MLLRAVLAIALCFVASSAFQRQKYDGDQVLRCVPQQTAQVAALRSIRKNLPNIRWWTEPRAPGYPVHIHVTSEQMMSLFNDIGLNCSVMIKDLQTAIDQERVDIMLRQAYRQSIGEDNFDYETYNQLEDIENWVDDIVKQYPDYASKFVIGKSFEGRNMNALKISSSNTKKPAVYIEGGIHACEWISPATVIYMTKLLLNSTTDPEVKKMIDGLDWYIVPVVNVDGYTYTWKTDRMWRKTRHVLPNQTCVGVDPNRNWPFHWGEDGAGTQPCADNYRGPKPLSESEVANITHFLSSPDIDFRGFIDFHSFSQFWMYPWGYTHDPCPDAAEFNKVSKLCVDALEKVHGTKYTYGNIADIIYVASGSSADWAYATARIKYSFGVELRDTGKHGFLLPADEIRPSGEETFAALQQWALYILQQQ